MATNTTNYQLKKPATTDYVTIGDINDNMDKIDAQMHFNALEIAKKIDIKDLATVATSGSYNDLANKPTIPTIPSVTVGSSGSGNVISNVTASGHALTMTKSQTLSATQTKGGLSALYTINTTGYKTIAQMQNATTFWKTNGGHAYVKLFIEASTIAEGTIGATNMKSSSWLVEATYSGMQQSITTTPINANAGTGAGVLRYLASFSPKTTSYCPQIAVGLDTAETNVYVRVTILSSSSGWQLPSPIGGDPGTKNYNRWYVEQGRYNYSFSSNKLGVNITGNCDGTAGSVWDTLRNDRYVFGESAVVGSIMALASDGYMYKLRNGANKEFKLPLHLGRSTGKFTYTAGSPATLTNYAQVTWNVRSLGYSDLTNASMQGTAFTVPKLTAGQYGQTLYVTGSLSSGGNFVPDGNITLSMVNGKTNIPIGRIDRSNTALNAVPTLFTLTGYGQNAYTLDSNGILTHIDGKQVKDTNTTYSAGTGLALSGTKFNHSNSVTAKTDYLGSSTSVPMLKYDAQGHITATSTATIYPPTTAGKSGQYWKSDGSGTGVWQTLDTTPESGSGNAITSGAVYTALNEKQKKITVSTSQPSGGSNGDIWLVYE